jgi:hypothetical protein
MLSRYKLNSRNEEIAQEICNSHDDLLGLPETDVKASNSK